MSDNEKERVEEETQTRLHVYPHTFIDEENAAIAYCDRVCQTAISTFPELEPNVFYSLLEFIPYKDITQDSVRIVDLPRKARLQFKIPDKDNTEDDSLTSQCKLSDLDTLQIQKGGLKRKFSDEDSVNISVIHPVRQTKRETKDNVIQTNLTVLPHILDENNIANVYTELPVQTAITLVPKESYTVVVSALETYPRESSGSQTSNTALPIRAARETPATTSFTRSATDGNDSIDRTAQRLASSRSIESNIKEILQFTTNTISSEIAKITKIYSSSDLRCQCVPTSCKKNDAVTNTSKSEVPSSFSMQKTVDGTTGNITNVNNEGENTKIKIHSSDNKSAEVRNAKQPIKEQTAKRSPTPNANRKVCSAQRKKPPAVADTLENGCSTTIEKERNASNAAVSNPSTSGVTPIHNKTPQEAFGDHKLKKRKIQNISCECHPSGTGAAPAISPIHTPVSSGSQISQQIAKDANQHGVLCTSKNTQPINSQASDIKVCFKCDVGVPETDTVTNSLKSSQSCPENRLQAATVRLDVDSENRMRKPFGIPRNPYITLKDTSKCECESCGTNTTEYTISCLKTDYCNHFMTPQTEVYDSNITNLHKETDYRILFMFGSYNYKESDKRSKNQTYRKKQKVDGCNDSYCNLKSMPRDLCSGNARKGIEKDICNSNIPKLKNKRYKSACISISTLSQSISIWCNQTSSESVENVPYNDQEISKPHEISDNASSLKYTSIFGTAKPKEPVIGLYDEHASLDLNISPKLLENSMKNSHANSYTTPNINFDINELKERKTDLCICNNGLTPLPKSNSGNLQDNLNISHIIVHINTQQIREPCRNFVLRVKMVAKEKACKRASSSKLKPSEIDIHDASIAIVEQDTEYVEHYIEELKDIEDGVLDDFESDTESLDSVVGSCTSITEMPWHKIALPEPGSYIIKPTKSGKGGREISGFKECDCDAVTPSVATLNDDAQPEQTEASPVTEEAAPPESEPAPEDAPGEDPEPPPPPAPSEEPEAPASGEEAAEDGGAEGVAEGVEEGVEEGGEGGGEGGGEEGGEGGGAGEAEVAAEPPAQAPPEEKPKEEEYECDESENLALVHAMRNPYRYMEPYMDRLYAKYAADEICPPGIEMPWHDILLPARCKLKKTRKERKKKDEDDFTGMFITLEQDLFEDKGNDATCKPSVPFAVCGAAASQNTVSCVSTVSELSKPKRCPKEFTLHIGLGKSDVQIGFQSGEGEIKPIPLGTELHPTDSQPFVVSTEKKVGDKGSYVVSLKSSGKVNVPQDDSAILAVVDAPPMKGGMTAICDGNTCYISPKNPPLSTVPCPADSSNKKNLKATVSFKKMGQKDKTVTNVMRMAPGEEMNVKVPDTNFNVVMKVSDGDVSKKSKADKQTCPPPCAPPPPACPPPPPKCACKENKSDTFKQDAVMAALESYEAEMKPLKQALYGLQEKIRSLNITEMQNNLCSGPPRQEQSCFSNAMPSYSAPPSCGPQGYNMFSEQDAFAMSAAGPPPQGSCPLYNQPNYMYAQQPQLPAMPSGGASGQYSCPPQCGPPSNYMSLPSSVPCPPQFGPQNFMSPEPTFSPPMNGNYCRPTTQPTASQAKSAYTGFVVSPPPSSLSTQARDHAMYPDSRGKCYKKEEMPYQSYETYDPPRPTSKTSRKQAECPNYSECDPDSTGNSEPDEDAYKCPFMEVVREMSNKNLKKSKPAKACPPKKPSPTKNEGCPASCTGDEDALRSGTGIKTEPAQFCSKIRITSSKGNIPKVRSKISLKIKRK